MLIIIHVHDLAVKVEDGRTAVFKKYGRREGHGRIRVAFMLIRKSYAGHVDEPKNLVGGCTMRKNLSQAYVKCGVMLLQIKRQDRRRDTQ